MTNALSLFDGISTAKLALENNGIKIGQYFASEIEPDSIAVSEDNHPGQITRLGDVTKISYVKGKLITENGIFDAPKIDIIFSGSPCTDISPMGKSEGLHGEQSKLFFEFIRILNEVRTENPDVIFFQENVRGSVTDLIGISKALGISPVFINSRACSAQNRPRYYWSNIRTKRVGLFDELVTDIPQPSGPALELVDVLDVVPHPLESGDATHLKIMDWFFSEPVLPGFPKKGMKKARCLLTSEGRPHSDMKKALRRFKKFGNIVFTDPNVQNETTARILSQSELERLQGLPVGYTKILSRNKAASVIGNGWELNTVSYIFSFLKTE